MQTSYTSSTTNLSQLKQTSDIHYLVVIPAANLGELPQESL